MKLDKNLLKDTNHFQETYNGQLYHALGQYDSMEFTVRLRRDVHLEIQKHIRGVSLSKDITFEEIQAFSTYFHETIHWWQHIGSTTGLILSLSYPTQTHINRNSLNKYLEITGAIKPIRKFNDLNAKEYLPKDIEFQTINKILNNYYDIDFFKKIVISFNSFQEIVKHPMFVSVGHSFHITYSSFLNTLASSIDHDFKFLPKTLKWEKSFNQLRDAKVMGYYLDSDILLPPLGLKEIYEGQARFAQIQYLYFGIGEKLEWEDFDELGMLSGVYIEAFDLFLEIINEKRPKSINDPLVALFLLICDISINPSSGFPFEIDNYERFIYDVDPGIRFSRLCKVVREKFPDTKDTIKEYSSSEYYDVSNKLCNALGYSTPLESAEEISKWSEEEESLIRLMEEEKVFDFLSQNFPIRLIFSQFIKFQKDKLKNPAFFCWIGVYSAGNKFSEENMALFSEHEALYTDGIDGDIYPRQIENKKPENIQNTMDIFYTWIIYYNLTKQWIMDDGEFDYNCSWLTTKYTPEEVRAWVKKGFTDSYKISPDEFEIL